MPYLISALVTGAGVVVLLTLLMRLIGPARRLAGIIRLSQARLADRCALLTARIAALPGRAGPATPSPRRGSSQRSADRVASSSHDNERGGPDA